MRWRFSWIADEVQNLARENNFALLNLAAACLGPGEAYVTGDALDLVPAGALDHVPVGVLVLRRAPHVCGPARGPARGRAALSSRGRP